MSTVTSVDTATNSDEKVSVQEIPEVMLDNDGRGVQVDRDDGGVENSLKISGHDGGTG